jgi:hypothetical protein
MRRGSLALPRIGPALAGQQARPGGATRERAAPHACRIHRRAAELRAPRGVEIGHDDSLAEQPLPASFHELVLVGPIAWIVGGLLPGGMLGPLDTTSMKNARTVAVSPRTSIS